MKRHEIAPLVHDDIDARIAKGTKEYGEPLTSHNGRDALQDAYEEALDLSMYLKQELVERGHAEDAKPKAVWFTPDTFSWVFMFSLSVLAWVREDNTMTSIFVVGMFLQGAIERHGRKA